MTFIGDWLLWIFGLKIHFSDFYWWKIKVNMHSFPSTSQYALLSHKPNERHWGLSLLYEWLHNSVYLMWYWYIHAAGYLLYCRQDCSYVFSQDSACLGKHVLTQSISSFCTLDGKINIFHLYLLLSKNKTKETDMRSTFSQLQAEASKEWFLEVSVQMWQHAHQIRHLPWRMMLYSL